MNALGIARRLGTFNNHFFAIVLLVMGVAILVVTPGILPGVLGVGSLVVGIFFLTIAHVEIEETGLKYRRFSRWHAVGYGEIEACGENSRLGYVKLRRYVFPWGKLYFVLPNASESLLGKDTRLLTSIRDKVNGG
jgi:hypothetical protein